VSRLPGDISCREVVEIVTEYLEGTLDEDRRRRLEVHLQSCDPCVEYIEQVRRTSRLAAEASLDGRPDRDALLAVFRAYKAG
jgi:anti-sigma factor RsiW